MYNSDTVYSTTTFRPVSPAPATPSPRMESPQRTRKLETPLHFDGGLFSDIRSKDGKLLSKVTVDRMHCSSRRDVTNSPSVYESVSNTGKDYVDDIVKTETITNEEVIKVKFTPVLEFNAPRLLTPSQFERPQTPVPYIKDGFEDLQSYKIVNSICKEKQFQSNLGDEIKGSPSPLPGFLSTESVKSTPSPLAGFLNSESIKRSPSPAGFVTSEPVKMTPSPLAGFLNSEPSKIPLSPLAGFLNSEPVKRSPSPIGFLVSEPIARSPSPLANFLVSEQLTKIDHYLQESLEACGGKNAGGKIVQHEDTFREVQQTQFRQESQVDSRVYSASDYRKENVTNVQSYATETPKERKKSKVNSVKVKEPGVLRAIYNMPVHYHAIILCFFLIVYNLMYQYVKENCHGKK